MPQPSTPSLIIPEIIVSEAPSDSASSNAQHDTPSGTLTLSPIAGFLPPTFDKDAILDGESTTYQFQDPFGHVVSTDGDGKEEGFESIWNYATGPGGLIPTLHPGWALSEMDRKKQGESLLAGFSEKSGPVSALWVETPSPKSEGHESMSCGGTLGSLYVTNAQGEQGQVEFKFDDGNPADTLNRLRKETVSRPERVR